MSSSRRRLAAAATVLLRGLAVLVIVLGALSLAHAQQAPPTSEGYTAELIRKFDEKGKPALREVASKPGFEPWVVTDLLVGQERFDIAEALAQAARAPHLAKLGDYVAAQRESPCDARTREIQYESYDRARAGDWQGIVDLAAETTASFDHIPRLEIERMLGLAHQRLGRVEECIATWRGCAEALHELGWIMHAGTVYELAASAAFESEAWQIAEELTSLRLAVEIEARSIPGQAYAHNNLGKIAETLGDPQNALVHYQKSLELKRTGAPPPQIAQTLRNIASVQRTLGELEESRKNLREVAAIYRQVGDLSEVANTLSILADVERLRGDARTGLELFREAQALFEQAGDAMRAAREHHGIGTCLAAIGDLAGALASYERRLELMEELGDPTSPSATVANIGGLLHRTGDLDASRRTYERALRLVRDGGATLNETIIIMNLGNVAEAAGDIELALRRFEEARALADERDETGTVAAALQSIASTLAGQRRYDEALETLDTAIAMRRKMGAANELASALLAKAQAHRNAGDLAAARAALAAAREARTSPPGVEEYSTLAGIAFDEGRYDVAADAAAECLKRAARLSGGLSDVERAGIRERYSGVQQLGLVAAHRAQDAERLTRLLEHGAAASLRESLGSRTALERAVIPAALQDELEIARSAELRASEALRAAIARKNLAQVRAAREELAGRQSELTEVSRRIEREAHAGAAVALSPPDDLATIRGRLLPDETLVYLAETEQEAVALVVTAEGAVSVSLAASKAIASATAALLDAKDGVSADAVAPLAALISEPLAKHVGTGRLLIVPTGRLGYVPFRLLFPDHDMVCVPSGSALGLLGDEADGATSGVLALGDPTYGGERESALVAMRSAAARWTRLAPLPGTRKEVERIGTVRLLGDEASESGLRAALEAKEGRWRAVHFACHGLVDPDQPMFSALALTPDTNDDGLLTALEIFRSRIPADLVVMSACDTAKGRVYRTEGIVGLTRAFMFAGSPRVLASLWKVDDEATQALMIRFYELWNPSNGTPGLDAAAALRQAQQFVRGHDKWEHPRYWAAWVIWGRP